MCRKRSLMPSGAFFPISVIPRNSWPKNYSCDFQNQSDTFIQFFAAIKATSDALRDEGFDCAAYTVDISDKEQVYEVAKRVKLEVGKVDILINNAGIVTCRTLLDLPDKAIETTYGVNILSHYWVSD